MDHINRGTDREPGEIMDIISRAPHRIELAGGGTDMPPYTIEKQGAVLNFAIDKYVWSTIGHNPVTMGSDTFLEKGAYQWVQRKGYKGPRADLWSDLKDTRGLGSSSTATVSMLAAYYDALCFHCIPKHEIAVDAFNVERRMMQMEGGAQDQFAAAYGGFNIMTFGASPWGHRKDAYGAVVYPLRVPRHVVIDIERKMLVLDTGKRHKDVIDNQRSQSGHHNLRFYDKAVKFAWKMADDLVRGNIIGFYKTLAKTHENKLKFCTEISTPAIDEVYEIAMKHGADACRIQGAGAGGCMLVMASPVLHDHIIEATAHVTREAFKASVDTEGVQVWRK